ncbi:hypothetical protein [Halomonas sp. G11]|uniref:hypothetical protein n=1 Tax=Halomonas sp. G11 TaxID=1684425 RepID=UPI0008000EF9|nr:hypothetical protein [Halomonas sp. G11]OAZ93491.1 hypothetical protein ADS46_04560 [Halomonas sp. G11]
MDRVINILKILVTKGLKSVGFILVAGGIAAINPDLILALALLFVEFNTREPLQGNDIAGWIMIGLGISLFLLDYYLYRDESPRRKRDVSNFNALESIASYEDINDSLNHVAANHCLFPSHQDLFDDYYSEISKYNSKYWNASLEKNRKKVQSTLEEAIAYFQLNYFDIGGNRVMLQPDLRKTKEYEVYVSKEHKLIEEFRSSYIKFKSVAKKKLKL